MLLRPGNTDEQFGAQPQTNILKVQRLQDRIPGLITSTPRHTKH